MSAFFRFAGGLSAVVITAVLTMLLTATSALAKHPTPSHSGDSVSQPSLTPIVPTPDTGIDVWYLVAVAAGMALVAAAAAVAVVHHRHAHRAHHGQPAA